MRPKMNGVIGLELADFGPYKIWFSDLWECPACGFELLTGFAQTALSEHFKDDFKECLHKFRDEDKRPVFEFD